MMNVFMKKYVFKPYNQNFPNLFLAEKERILSRVEISLSIEHVGSTAVPGLGGKGIIDLALAVEKKDIEAVSAKLQGLGYELRKEYSTPGRLYFVIYLPDPEQEVRRYHLHLTPSKSEDFKNFIAFRDYLKSDPKAAKEYGKIKEKAALEANHDGEKYRKLKESVFVKFFAGKSAPNLSTERLLLRQWKDDDLLLFARMNANKEVMEYFPAILSTKESDVLAQKIRKELSEKKYGLWAVEVKGVAPFIGFVGLHYQDFPAPFTPCIEIGWRLSHEHWNKGYAFEAATKVAQYAFNDLKLEELVSFTTKGNHRSRKLMEKLGMTHDVHDDFEHSNLDEGHPLRSHVLYRLVNETF